MKFAGKDSSDSLFTLENLAYLGNNTDVKEAMAGSV